MKDLREKDIDKIVARQYRKETANYKKAFSNIASKSGFFSTRKNKTSNEEMKVNLREKVQELHTLKNQAPC